MFVLYYSAFAVQFYMTKTILLLFAVITLLNNVAGQQIKDTTPALLQEITVRAFEQNSRLKDVAAPVAVINTRQLERFGNTSILQAVNTAPGVRMEERSPGSYRLNIRGSTLRSPFGVRNVKVYLNEIPFTDPGGNTYLNQLSFFDVEGIEIIKGPGSSLYGSGTGGVMLITDGQDSIHRKLSLSYSKGSFNTDNINIAAVAGNEALSNKISYTHQQSEGYRIHSAMRRDIVSWQTNVQSSEKQSLSAHILYGDLFYQTPGGLTKAQYDAGPRSARPATSMFPGAVENKAAIYQKMFWAGIQQQYRFNEKLQNTTSIYGAFSQIKNPAILNYEKRSEPHFGGRSSFSFTTHLAQTQLNIVAGAEFQQGYFSIKVYNNNAGSPDSLRTDDEVNNRQLGIFSQASFIFPAGWIATAGISLNKTDITFNRLSFVYKTRFNNEWAPRLSLLKKVTEQVSFYGVVSKGFSPPTVAELLPSTTVINTDLEAEQGINYEAGVRGSFLRNRLYADVSAFYFSLNNAITQRRDQSGADYFVNAGDTRQRGIEAAVSYQITRNEFQFITGSTLWANYAYTNFRYKTFRQVNSDISGNRLPGVPPNTFTGGIDITTQPGIYLNLTYYYSDHFALNDANTEYGTIIRLPGFKAGYKRHWGDHFITNLFVRGDNLLNQKYSLGYDINAAGGRFYNAAPAVNYEVGVSVSIQ